MINDLSALNAQSDKPQRAAKVQATFLLKRIERFLNHDLRKMFPYNIFNLCKDDINDYIVGILSVAVVWVFYKRIL